jgi:hypothetical protein
MSKGLPIHTGYMYRAFESAFRLAENLRDTLADYQVSPETLVGTGLSGALVVPRIAEHMGLSWLIVRKKGDGSHSLGAAEGTLGGSWLFVDDCIDSGATYKRVYRAVQGICREHEFTTKHLGAWLYQGDSFKQPSWIAEWCEEPPAPPAPSLEAFDPAYMRDYLSILTKTRSQR